MTTNIKITALTDIGANLAYGALLPVVDMAGTPATKKANLQVVGNLFLSNAGGPNFVPAARSLTAATVTNAAQSNITSVGNLTALNVTGNTTTGNLTSLGNVTAVTFTGTLVGSATTASTVSGNAQANITSVGTLANLVVNGNVTIGGDLKVATLAMQGGAPLASGNSVITHKIPVTINGNTYYIALTSTNA